MRVAIELPDEIQKQSHSLAALGLHETAWPKVAALEVLRHLEGRPVAVLGGDVYRTSGSNIKPAYENWYCERAESEPQEVFARRSQAKAAEFISKFVDFGPELFVLVMC